MARLHADVHRHLALAAGSGALLWAVPATGYQPDEVTFTLGAIGLNLRIMPADLMQAMPMLVLGLIALAWIIVRWLVVRRVDGEVRVGPARSIGRWRPRRVVVRDLGPVLRVHLDDRPDQRH